MKRYSLSIREKINLKNKLKQNNKSIKKYTTSKLDVFYDLFLKGFQKTQHFRRVPLFSNNSPN